MITYADCGFIRNGGFWVVYLIALPIVIVAAALVSFVWIKLIKKKEHQKKRNKWGTTKENNPLPICKAAWVYISEG